MICISSEQGLTGQSFCKAKTIYYNDFDKVTQSRFQPETDNIKAYNNLTNFLFNPIIGYDGKPNGVIQLYSLDQPITRLKVKKMIAMRKFVGGCLDSINLLNGNLEMVVGAMSEVHNSMEMVIEREKIAELEQRQTLELQSMVKTARKEITTWYTRAQTEPGFIAPPIEESREAAALRKFQEQQAIELALEAKKEAALAAQQEKEET